jgi:hypothetical protein
MRLVRLNEQRRSMPCYCGHRDEEILNDIKRGAIPDEALVNNCCYKTICKVRGTYFSQSDYEEYAETWSEICRKKGYLQQRHNSRGF